MESSTSLKPLRGISSVQLEEDKGFSFLDLLSPTAQTYLKRAAGLGVTLYLSRAVIASPEFQDILAALGNFGGTRLLGNNWFPKPEDEYRVPLMEIPAEYRNKIWEYLGPEDLKNLRQVSKRLQSDVDYVVGVHAGVNGLDPENLDWIRRVAVQSCTVRFILNLRNWDFLIKPQLLRTLRICEGCKMAPEVLSAVLNLFENLQSLTFYIKDDGTAHDLKSQEILGRLGRTSHDLTFLKLKYIPEVGSFKWHLKFTKAKDIRIQLRNRGRGSPSSPARLKYINLNFEFSNFDGPAMSAARCFWKQVLDKQRQLGCLLCNVGPVSFDVFAQVIQANYLSIQRIELCNVTCWDFWNAREEKESGFDWNFFTVPPRLVQLSIGTEPGPRFGPLVYKALEPCSMHLKILFCNFGLVFWRIYSGIVLANTATLQAVTLLRITTFDRTNGNEEPFDWALFKDCKALKTLAIGGQHLTYFDHVNFKCVPAAGLSEFLAFWMTFSRDDVLFIAQNMPGLVSPLAFIHYCKVLGLADDESPMGLLESGHGKGAGIIPGFGYLDELFGVVENYPEHVLALLGTLWLLYIK